jgi:hypothetical protein
MEEFVDPRKDRQGDESHVQDHVRLVSGILFSADGCVVLVRKPFP